MTAVCTEQGLPAWVCYGQAESRFHGVFLHGEMAVSDSSARRGRAAGAGFEPQHGRETAEKGEILHLLYVAPDL